MQFYHLIAAKAILFLEYFFIMSFRSGNSVLQTGLCCVKLFIVAQRIAGRGLPMPASSKKTVKRMSALAFLLCFAAAALLCGGFIMAHASHNHDHTEGGGECAVCAQMHNIDFLLKYIGAASLSIGLFGLFASLALLCYISVIQFPLPVHLKIRMNN